MEERLGEMRKGRRERIEKGSHCFFKSSGYDKLELKHKNLVCLSVAHLLPLPSGTLCPVAVNRDRNDSSAQSCHLRGVNM